MDTSASTRIPPVACVRCAAAAAHPHADHAQYCPGCGRDRSRVP